MGGDDAEAVALPGGGRLWGAAREGAGPHENRLEPAEGAGRGVRAGPALHLVRATAGRLAVQRDPATVPADRLRPQDGRADENVRALRQRLPARALAGREVAYVRYPPRGAHRSGPARPAHGRRALARV